MYAQKLSFDYAHTLHTVRIVHNAHSVYRSRVPNRQSCDCINFVRLISNVCELSRCLGHRNMAGYFYFKEPEGSSKSEKWC